MDELGRRRKAAAVISFYTLMISGLMSTCFSQEIHELQTTGLPTVTVRGFLNFKTTVDGTVIVFTPAAELPKTVGNIQQTTKPIAKPALSTNLIHQDGGLESREADPVGMQELDYSQPASVDESLHSGVVDLAHLGHKMKAPFLQHISDNAVLPSTIQTDNDLETVTSRKDSSSYNRYPTGLVTVLDGTRVEDGKTTIFETKVIGTYIDGKYAQILHSTSKIIVPTTTFYTPSYKSVGGSRSSELATETTTKQDVSPSILLKTTDIASTKLLGSFSSRTETLSSSTPVSKILSSTPSINSILSSSPTEKATSPTVVSIPTLSSSSETAHIMERKTQEKSFADTPSVFLRSSFQTAAFTSPNKVLQSTQSLETVKKPTFRTSSSTSTTMTWIRRTPDEDAFNAKSTSMRLSSIRSRFSAPRRPSQSVKLNRFKVKLTLRQNMTDGEMTTPTDEETTDHDEETEDEETYLGTTDDDMLDVDPAHVVYQETTITSKVTLHVGRRKSIRTLTITTSIPMRISPTEDAEVTMTADDTKHDHEVEVNPLAIRSVVSRTFTTTERTYTTSVVPVFDGTSTVHHTLTESLFIMKIVTAYKTLPPSDYTVLSTRAYDIEEVTEDVTSLDVAANVQTSVVEVPTPEQTTTTSALEIVQPSVPVVTIPNNNNNALNNPILSFGQALSNNPLAAVYLGLQQLNAQMTLYSTITQTSSYLTTDTFYSTKVVRFYDGRSTRYRTVSEPVSTKERTVTTTITQVQPYINTQAYQQQQQLQKLIAATQLPMPQQQTQQFSTLTTVYTTSTTATSLSTRIYTLIYNGFSTKFRTVTSTKTYPTVLTVTSTKEVPIITAQPQLLPFAYPYPAA